MVPELTEKQIKEIRALRRRAVRRRQVLVLSLVAVILIVFFCALGMHFSVCYTLIPIFLLALVVFLGIRASKQAIAWEKKISELQKKPRREDKAKFETDEAPTYILPAQQSEEVQFKLEASDNGVRSLDLRAFNQGNFTPREQKETDLEKADLL